MPDNPYSAAAARWALIVLGLAGFIAAGFVAANTLLEGSTNGCFRRVCVSDRIWTAAHDPAQFWIYVLFWSAAAFFMGRTAWKAWREG